MPDFEELNKQARIDFVVDEDVKTARELSQVELPTSDNQVVSPKARSPIRFLARRSLAGIVDFVLIYAAVWLITPSLSLFSVVVCPVVYELLTIALKGRSLGKRLSGLYVVDTDCKPLKLTPLIVRSVIKLFTYPIIPAVVSFGVRRQLHDLASGAWVIEQGEEPNTLYCPSFERKFFPFSLIVSFVTVGMIYTLGSTLIFTIAPVLFTVFQSK